MTRKQIHKKIQENNDRIKKLKIENRNLELQSLLICDKNQWFKEEIETVKIRENRKLISQECLIGKIYWKETFNDEGTGKKITIERNMIVRKDGLWII